MTVRELTQKLNTLIEEGHGDMEVRTTDTEAGTTHPATEVNVDTAVELKDRKAVFID